MKCLHTWRSKWRASITRGKYLKVLESGSEGMNLFVASDNHAQASDSVLDVRWVSPEVRVGASKWRFRFPCAALAALFMKGADFDLDLQPLCGSFRSLLLEQRRELLLPVSWRTNSLASIHTSCFYHLPL